MAGVLDGASVAALSREHEANPKDAALHGVPLVAEAAASADPRVSRKKALMAQA